MRSINEIAKVVEVSAGEQALLIDYAAVQQDVTLLHAQPLVLVRSLLESDPRQRLDIGLASPLKTVLTTDKIRATRKTQKRDPTSPACGKESLLGSVGMLVGGVGLASLSTIAKFVCIN